MNFCYIKSLNSGVYLLLWLASLIHYGPKSLETFVVAMSGDSGGSIGRFAAKHPTMHMTIPHSQESNPK